jgi:hypothetical protein
LQYAEYVNYALGAAVSNAADDSIETDGASQRNHEQQDAWWKSELAKRGLTVQDGRQLEDEGITSRNGFTDAEIQAEMDRIAEEKSDGANDWRLGRRLGNRRNARYRDPDAY